MKLVIQRVTSASCTVAGDQASPRVSGAIGNGLFVLIGVEVSDHREDADYVVRKLLNCRLFDDAAGKPWAKSVVDMGYSVLLVSQFTLYAILNGNKPDFHNSLGGDAARDLYLYAVERLKALYSADKVQTGVFGAEMSITSCNNGPCTIEINSRPYEYAIAEAAYNKIGGAKVYNKYHAAEAKMRKTQSADEIAKTKLSYSPMVASTAGCV